MNIARLDSYEAGTLSVFRQALRDCSPILLGLIPFGLACGMLGTTAGLTPLEIILMSLLVFAGAAQFVAITMIATGVASWGIIAATLLINLRYLLLGAYLAPYTIKQPPLQQGLLSFLLTDESYALTANRIDQQGYHPTYQFGCSIPLYLVWQLSTILGIIVGSFIDDPLAWGLDFAMPATFMVLLFPRLTNRINFIVFGVAAVSAVLGALLLPGKWYLIIACLAATVTGGILEGECRHEN